MSARSVARALTALADPERAQAVARFFKTAAGEYSAGDRFLGISVPAQRTVAKAHAALPLDGLATLIQSPIHEHRLTALLILVAQYERGDAAAKKARVTFYVRHLAGVNNWDLVDSSAHQILGAHLLTRDRQRLHRLAKSKSLWERRVAIVATYAFIGAGETQETFAIAEQLLSDTHDLIHKATGWMLREVGKRVSERALREFLEKNASRMPRTALRYAIERFPAAERKTWLARPRLPQ
jgi:3-methyladenine DNA glycosylase AlkD